MSLYKRLIIHFIVMDIVARVVGAIADMKMSKLKNMPHTKLNLKKELGVGIVILASVVPIAIYKYYNLIQIFKIITKLI